MRYQRVTDALPTRYQCVSAHFPIYVRNSTRYRQIILKSIYYILFNKKVVTRGNALNSHKNHCHTVFFDGNAYGNALVTRW